MKGDTYKTNIMAQHHKMMEEQDKARDARQGVAEDSAKDKKLDSTPVSKGHKPNGAHGRAAVRALGRTKTTGNFKKIEKAKGKGAAIAAYQNALKSHKAGK